MSSRSKRRRAGLMVAPCRRQVHRPAAHYEHLNHCLMVFTPTEALAPDCGGRVSAQVLPAKVMLVHRYQFIAPPYPCPRMLPVWCSRPAFSRPDIFPRLCPRVGVRTFGYGSSLQGKGMAGRRSCAPWRGRRSRHSMPLREPIVTAVSDRLFRVLH